jgi:hypothetical protein
MRVVEAGRDEAALEVDGARARVGRRDLARGADGDDALAVDGDGLGHVAARVGGEDLAVGEDEADVAPASLRARPHGDERRRHTAGGQQQCQCEPCAQNHLFRTLRGTGMSRDALFIPPFTPRGEKFGGAPHRPEIC